MEHSVALATNAGEAFLQKIWSEKLCSVPWSFYIPNSGCKSNASSYCPQQTLSSNDPAKLVLNMAHLLFSLVFGTLPELLSLIMRALMAFIDLHFCLVAVASGADSFKLINLTCLNLRRYVCGINQGMRSV